MKLIWEETTGYTFHSVETDDYALRILCAGLQLTIVNVGYRLAPEHPWPVPLDDCYAAVKWVSKTSVRPTIVLTSIDHTSGLV